MVLTLAIDTSSVVTSVALHDGGRSDDQAVVQCVDEHAPHRHVELLAPAVEAVLQAAGCRPRDLGRVAVGVGPGPFTGLRVGLMTARALGHALDVEVVGVGSLDAIAAQVVGSSVVVVTDARRREVYWAQYAADGVALSPAAVDKPDALAEHLRASDFTGEVVGLGRSIYPDAFREFPGTADVSPSAAWVARLAAAGRGTSSTAPLYLRRPDAQTPGPRKPVQP
ncbi:MAG TPA: tRNA (adenosine(37)-N6)-threonylcarbamoyltransferase complex dimerization subunit type 1 TsaB [Mycobacteriales bacterium]|nr:tRNA (adenosine(37)-N6)-threonylcarbamoyltransferase complex dimerization subunit type 1 TsaB [Mycobacteriales bacterium]